MCSVYDFIDKQKYFIEIKRKTIESLNEFLDSINKPLVDVKLKQTANKNIENGGRKELKYKPKSGQTNEETNDNCVSNNKIESNILMLGTNGFLNWIDSQKSEQKRQRLAEERREEYNNFLKQKKLESEKKCLKRVTKGIPDYNDLLNDKRLEEQKHRQLNGLDDIEDIILTNGISSVAIDSSKVYPELPAIGWSHCSNNKYVEGYITPRSRLLATHSSRIRAAKYREELEKQVKEKEKMKAQERERIRLEEEELERKLETQRKKLLEEFETEHRLKQKQKLIEKEVNNQLLNNEIMVGSTSPLSLLRSPTYLHLKERTPNLSPKKHRSVSRSLGSALSQTRTTQSMATQTTDEQKEYFASDESDNESSISSEDEIIDENKAKEDEFRRRVLSQLSEVRQMMESDHIKMMEQLREQQLSQLDE